MAVPVIAELASDARNRATSAISAGSISVGFSDRPFVLSAARKPSVSVPPGQMAFTFIPYSYTSAASDSVKLIKPDFVTR